MRTDRGDEQQVRRKESRLLSTRSSERRNTKTLLQAFRHCRRWQQGEVTGQRGRRRRKPACDIILTTGVTQTPEDATQHNTS